MFTIVNLAYWTWYNNPDKTIIDSKPLRPFITLDFLIWLGTLITLVSC